MRDQNESVYAASIENTPSFDRAFDRIFDRVRDFADDDYEYRYYKLPILLISP